MVDILFIFSKRFNYWFSRAEVDRTMPKSFRKFFPKTRVIIDATEIRTQIPKSVRAAVLKYSSYKHYHSIKVLIGIGKSVDIFLTGEFKDLLNIKHNNVKILWFFLLSLLFFTLELANSALVQVMS